MKLENVDDVSLIGLIADARNDALQELYDRYNHLVFSVAFAILGDRILAQEATLDVFVRIWQRAGTYRPERAKVSTWLIAITRHHAIDILRWQTTNPEPDGMSWEAITLHADQAAHDPEEQAELSVQKDRIRWAFAQLPVEQREVLVLAYLRGYTHSEIAKALKEPLGTIKTRVRLGMQKLRQLLEED
jgi:RNA polymerase sigma-70 factor (ECF subfamily)